MFYVVGLGNPGKEYEQTRHNVGWLVLDFVQRATGMPEAVSKRQVSGRLSEGNFAGQPVVLFYPDTFMNNSGSAVVKLVPPAEVGNLIVIHDDIALPFGEVRLGSGRGDGGHNGIKSIISKLGTKDFVRLRIGVAQRSFLTGKVKRPAGGGPLERFVLKPFTASEGKQLPFVFAKVREALEIVVSDGVEAAMNKINVRPE